MAIDVVSAEIKLQAAEYTQALASLTEVKTNVTRYPYVLSLLSQAYQGLGDWDALLEHERGSGQLIEQLRNGIEHAPLEGGAARRKAALIRQMLSHDAEIRRLTQPWLARVESLLSTDSNRRRFDGAYL